MAPRLKTSITPSPLPEDALKPVKAAVEKNFKKELKGKTVTIKGNVYKEELVVTIVITEKESIRPLNFEASVDVKGKNAMDQLYLALDALGSMLQQYLEAEGDIELPTIWHEFEMDGKKVYLQFHRDNPDLEREANRILGH